MRRGAFAVALFCLLALDAAAAALDPPKPNEKWITFTVGELQFISNASPAKTLDIARDMLQMRAAIGQVTSLNVRSKRPTKVFLFADARRFNAYRDALLQRKVKHVDGMYARGDTSNFMLFLAGNNLDRVVHHELTHYLVQNSIGELPIWLNEGIADYYAPFRIDGKSMQIGRPMREHLLWLRAGSMIPLQQLLTATKASPIYSEGLFYAQSWALVHYLLAEPERHAKLVQFLSLLDDGKGVDAAFATAFAMKYADLEQELRNSVHRLAFSYRSIPLRDATIIAELPEPVPMRRDVLLFELGRLFAQAGGANAQTAERFLRESLAANPNNAAAHADLGRVYEMLRRHAQADAEYATAMKLGSDDPDILMQAADTLSERHVRMFAARPPRAEVLKVRALYERVTELDPTRVAAWIAFGGTYLVQTEDLGPGIAALEKGLELAPGNYGAIVLLASLYRDAGRGADATKLMATLDLSSNVDEKMKAYLDSIVRDFDTESTHARIVTAMNDAITKADAGQYQEALALVDAILPSIVDGESRDAAMKFREDVSARLKRK